MHRGRLAALAAAACASAATTAPAVAATPQQDRQKLASDAPNAQVVTSRQTDRASFVRGDVSAATLGGSTSSDALADSAISRYAGLIGVSNPSSELRKVSTTSDKLGMRKVRYQQQVGGVPVYNSRVDVQLGKAGEGMRAISSGFVPGISGVSTTPKISQGAAEIAAASVVPNSRAFAPTQLVVFAGTPAKASQAKLAYAVDRISNDGATHKVVMVDAASGKTIASLQRIMDAKNRSTYTANNLTLLPGTLVYSEGDSTSGGDTDAVHAHEFSGDVYDYYENTFGRDSYDDAGAELISTVHYSVNYQNAFWNGEQMVYGDDFPDLDVAGHEITHAVTERTAGLEYADQSGALNESISDMAGWDIDPGDSTIGEDLPIGAIRDMEDPEAYGQPAQAADYVCTSSDNGGVHTNSGITNKVYANLVDTIGRADAEQVRYRAQTTYLQPSSSFADARAAFVSAASDVGADATAVANAFDAQGITADWAPSC